MVNRPIKDGQGNPMSDEESEKAVRFVQSKVMQEAIDKAVAEIAENRRKAAEGEQPS